MLIQKLPAADEHDVDAWARINHLAGTIERDELLRLAGKVDDRQRRALRQASTNDAA